MNKQLTRIIVMILTIVLLYNIVPTPVLAISTDDDLVVKVVGSQDDGDCIIITHGDKEILIDTTQGNDGINCVEETMNLDSNKIWEYVIFTHPDEDHIGKTQDLFDLFNNNNWKIGTIIDFGYKTYQKNKVPFLNYVAALKDLNYDYEYFSATDELDDSNSVKQFVVDKDVVINVLYNSCSAPYRSDNNLSVCILIEYKNQKLLFTGDLERSGEKELINNHRELTKNVTFFKASHHGSNGSNSEEFLDWIRPAYVAITKGQMGVWTSLYNDSGWYELPSISRFLKYTDYIYPTYAVYYNQFDMLFGTTEFIFNGNTVEVSSENNSGRFLRNALIDGEVWYNYLVDEFNTSYDYVCTYYFDENNIRDINGDYLVETNGMVKYCEFNCTLIKYGHYDILIDCGSEAINSSAFIDKLKDYIVDGTIEYLVVSNYGYSSISQIAKISNNQPSIFNTFSVTNVIDGKLTNKSSNTDTKYSKYLLDVNLAEERFSLGSTEKIELDIFNNLSISVYGSCNTFCNDEDEYSLYTVVKFRDRKMMFVGDQTNYKNFILNYGDELHQIDTFRYTGSALPYNSMNGFDLFLSTINPSVVFIGSPLNHGDSGRTYISMDSSDLFTNYIKNKTSNSTEIYSCGFINSNNQYTRRNGDIICVFAYQGVIKNTSISVESTARKNNPLTIDRF